MKHPKLPQKNYELKYRRLRRAYHRKEIQLRDLREDLFQLLEKTREGVFMADREGKLFLFNPEAQRITGYSSEEVLNQHFRMLLTLDDLADGFKFLKDTLNGEYTHASLFRIRKKDRSTAIVELNGAPFYMDGRLKGAVAFMRNITERKWIEAQNRPRVETFKQLNGKLEQWSEEIRTLKQEVNNLLRALGRQAKYPLE